MVGPVVYTWAKARRFGRSLIDWIRHPRRPRVMHPVAADPVPAVPHYDAVDPHKQSVRVA